MTDQHALQLQAGNCPKCGKPKSVRQSHTALNPGRWFATCPNKCYSSFQWLSAPPSRSTEDSKLNPINERMSQGRSSVERGRGAAKDGSDSPLELASELVSPTPLIAGRLAFLSSQPATVSLVSDKDDAIMPAGGSRPFVPSKYQSAIYDFLKSGNGNGVVIATAGSGKTSTIRNATPYLPRGAKVAAIAFNRRNSLDLQKVMPEWVRASTFHSLGLSNLKRANSKLKVDDDKVWNLLHRVEDRGGPLADVVAEDGPAIRQVVNLVKSTLSPTDNDSLSNMVEHYGIPLNGNAEPAFDIVRQVMTTSDADTDTVDFGDMLYRCANGSVGCEKFDFILQDEAQDATQSQIEFVKRSLKPTGRLLAVGDPRQAIYSWAGSAIDSIDQLTKYHHASTLPLSITYRLPLSHVENVNRRFPDVGMEARNNAPDGIIGNRSYPEMISKLADGDMVIARVNSVLVPAAFELIREGRKAVILGRDIGKNLGVLITKIQKRNPGANLNQVIGALRTYADREISKLIHARKASQAANLSDSVETIIALSDSCYTVSDIQRKISAVFSDDLKGTIFSSIHRAKGAEADNVYFLDPSKCPHPMAKEEWQKAGEMNCLFVALTRSKHGLYMVESD